MNDYTLIEMLEGTAKVMSDGPIDQDFAVDLLYIAANPDRILNVNAKVLLRELGSFAEAYRGDKREDYALHNGNGFLLDTLEKSARSFVSAVEAFNT